MQLGRVVGNCVATVKHATLKGWRLVLVQLLNASGGEDGEPVLAVDAVGSRMNDTVLLTNDGKGTRKLVGSNNTPARWMIMGICDE